MPQHGHLLCFQRMRAPSGWLQACHVINLDRLSLVSTTSFMSLTTNTDTNLRLDLDAVDNILYVMHCFKCLCTSWFWLSEI